MSSKSVMPLRCDFPGALSDICQSPMLCLELWGRFTKCQCVYIIPQISRAMSQERSIDQFLHTHQGNEKIELCGKLAIAQSIS